jgi:hypothetical protein
MGSATVVGGVEIGLIGGVARAVERDLSFICLKKGKDRLPQPGILTSQPEETSNNNSSIAEKMDRLFKVSRNRASLVENFQQTVISWQFMVFSLKSQQNQ